jgi:Phage Tail Collar Domain
LDSHSHFSDLVAFAEMTIIGTYPPVQLQAPTGIVAAFAGAAAPAGWLLCDGSAVSRATYSALFAVIGTTYGAGNGSTTFNLPDLRGRAVYGVGAGAPGVGSLGATEGQSNPANRGPYHGHSANNHSHGYDRAGPIYGGFGDGGKTGVEGFNWDFYATSEQKGIIDAQGYSVQNAPSHIGLNYIVKI